MGREKKITITLDTLIKIYKPVIISLFSIQECILCIYNTIISFKNLKYNKASLRGVNDTIRLAYKLEYSYFNSIWCFIRNQIFTRDKLRSKAKPNNSYMHNSMGSLFARIQFRREYIIYIASFRFDRLFVIHYSATSKPNTCLIRGRLGLIANDEQ